MRRDPVAQRPLRPGLRPRLGPGLRGARRGRAPAAAATRARPASWPRTGRSSDARPDRHLLLPARRRGRRAARAQAVPAPAGARRRGGRAGARRPEVRGPRPRARRSDPGRHDGAPGAVPRALPGGLAGGPAGGGPRRCARSGVRTAILGRGLLLPDPEVAWMPAATRAARRIVEERGIDVVLTTSPPASVHLVGSALRRRGDVRWVADLRDSWLANPHRRYEKRSVRAKRSVEERLARRILRRVDAVAAVTQFIADEARALVPAGTPLRVVPNGVDFDDFAGLVHAPSLASSDRAHGLVLRPALAAAVPRGAAPPARRPAGAAGPGRGPLPGRVPAGRRGLRRGAAARRRAPASRASGRTPRRSRR